MRRDIILFVLLCATAFLIWNHATILDVQRIREDVSMTFRPSAEKAFEYGQRYFSATHSSAYDIKRAEHFFRIAKKLDTTSSLLYLHHERARIAFLRGDFFGAMREINLQIKLHGEETPNSYYVRGLIEGFMGSYEYAIADYRTYLESDPHNWAAINDLAWVLLKAERPEDAVAATDEGLQYFPDNPWLLATNSIALYEVGSIDSARTQARKALIAVSGVTEERWLTAYPGNDPRVAREGVGAFQDAVRENMHTIMLASASSTVQ